MGKLIAVVGTTGIGKTTLVNLLSQQVSFTTGLEGHEQRPFQALFKTDPRYALANQMDYLLLRAEQERRLRSSPKFGLMDGGLEMDFFGFTRLFHARGLLTDDEFALCERFYRFIRLSQPPPDLIISMTASQEVIAARLAGRERINIASAGDISLLQQFLDEWLVSVDPDQLLHLDANENDASFTRSLPGLLDRIFSATN